MENEVQTIELNLAFNKRKPHKLTNPKKIILFQSLIDEFNVSKACRAIGITRALFDKYYNENEIFKLQVDEIRNNWLDRHEGAMFEVGSNASREGFQDRKLALQSFRRQTYGDKVDVSAKHQVNIDITVQELQGILHSNGVKKINSESKALPTTFEEL